MGLPARRSADGSWLPSDRTLATGVESSRVDVVTAQSLQGGDAKWPVFRTSCARGEAIVSQLTA